MDPAVPQNRASHERQPLNLLEIFQTASSTEVSDALTGLGKIPDGRLIALGTRPADDSHWFARMLKDGDKSMVFAGGRCVAPVRAIANFAAQNNEAEAAVINEASRLFDWGDTEPE